MSLTITTSLDTRHTAADVVELLPVSFFIGGNGYFSGTILKRYIVVYDCDDSYYNVYDELAGPPGLGAFRRRVGVSVERSSLWLDRETYTAVFVQIARLAKVVGGRGYCEDDEVIVFAWDEGRLIVNSSDRVLPVVGYALSGIFEGLQYEDLGVEW